MSAWHYASYMEQVVAILENPRILLEPRFLNDPATLRIVFLIIAVVCATLIFGLILYSDSKLNAPVPHVEEEDERDNIDYKRMLDQARQKEEILSGSTDRYDWQQNEGEVDVFIPLDKDFIDVKSKDIKVHFHPKTIIIQIQDVIHVEGELYAEIIPAECNWQIDQDTSPRKLWITLVKKLKTARNLHWSCVLRGDQQVDTKTLGPMVSSIDTHDKNSMKKAIGDLRQRIRDKSAN